jgi:hypothetical protein
VVDRWQRLHAIDAGLPAVAGKPIDHSRGDLGLLPIAEPDGPTRWEGSTVALEIG